MTHEPPPRRSGDRATPPASPSARHDDGGHDGEAPGSKSDRPTINPPFDLEAFARASVTVPAARGASSAPPGDARRHPTDTPTARPPAPDGTVPAARAEQITLTNEIELEKARAKSAAASSGAGAFETAARRTDPPRFTTPGALSRVNPRVPTSPGMPSALSMANARAPSSPSMPSALSMANARAPSSPGMPSAPPSARRPSPSNIEAAVLGAIGSAGPEITERTIDDPFAEMNERFSLGDYTGALEMAELILAEYPDDAAALECAESCRAVLEGMYAARLGPLDRVPSVLVQRTQLRWLSIDHRAGFVLSLVDGSSTLEMILDVCGMPRLDAIRILHELVQQKIVALKG